MPKLQAQATRTPHLYKHKLIRYVLETFLITPVTVNHRSYFFFFYPTLSFPVRMCMHSICRPDFTLLSSYPGIKRCKQEVIQQINKQCGFEIRMGYLHQTYVWHFIWCVDNTVQSLQIPSLIRDSGMY